MIEHARLLELLDYSPDTGVFTRKIGSRNRRAGSVAGSNSHGYREIKLDRKKYLAHRLAWFYVHGSWPKCLIDHIDMDRSNNRISNLREATHSTNKANRPRPANNKSGIKGVSFYKPTQKWQASICRQYKQTHLGFFESKESAAEAYRAAAGRLFGEFARVA